MKYILIISFLAIYAYGKGTNTNNTTDNTNRDYEFCVTTDRILKYQVKDVLNRYYVLSRQDIENFTDKEYYLFKSNYTVTAVLLEDYVE